LPHSTFSSFLLSEASIFPGFNLFCYHFLKGLKLPKRDNQKLFF